MTAVSASRAKVRIQFFFFACMLYFRPFWSNPISLLANGISVQLTALGWNVCCVCGVSFVLMLDFVVLLSMVL